MRIILSLLFLVGSFSHATAHEFWLEPLDFTIESGEELIADIRVGSDFSGSALSYRPGGFERFELWQGGQMQPVPGRIGDRPSMTMAIPGNELAVVIYQSGPSLLVYREYEKFEAFVQAEGLDGTLEAHAARDLPLTGFSERFTRYAKTLVAIGGGQGSDQITGMPLELIAQNNPYTDTGPIRVVLLYEGTPLQNVLLNIFHRTPEGVVSERSLRTDADGLVTLPDHAPGTVLLSAVHMLPIEADEGPVWHSLWASLTYQVE